MLICRIYCVPGYKGRTDLVNSIWYIMQSWSEFELLDFRLVFDVQQMFSVYHLVPSTSCILHKKHKYLLLFFIF